MATAMRLEAADHPAEATLLLHRMQCHVHGYTVSPILPHPPTTPSSFTDAVTKEWLKKASDPVFGFPSLVRFSWQTTDTLLESCAVPVTWEAEDAVGGQASIATFFGAGASGGGAGGKVCPVFKRMRVQRVAHL
jgi:hypothetical protein